jgi:uncharacterized RDD family membrane protein YckC
MTQIPAGWYPDPDPDAPEPKGQRYWDGQNWTDHTHPPPGQQAAPAFPAAATGETGPPDQTAATGQVGYPAEQAAATPPGPPVGGYGQAPPPSAPMTPYGGAVGAGGPVTPDGQQISGWGRRAGALLIDWVICTLATAVVGFSWVRDIVREYSDFVSRMLDAESGPSFSDQAEFANVIADSVFVLTLLGILVSFVYNVGLLKWRAATLGQMALGIKVRLREHPGPLSWGTVLLRWVGKQGYRLLGLVPFLGILGFVYKALNYLWPLWDEDNQAVHDKLAKTNVVRN